MYHSSGYALAGLAPIALILSPSSLNFPVDLALSVIIPYHSHVGLNYVISDYVPQSLRSLARSGLLGITLVTIGGLLMLNIEGPGLTQSVKGLWQPKKDAPSSAH